MPIRILPETVAAQIAAGEVVERPASVVKELVENALDAGASTIDVEIREGGRRLVRVSDDGEGVPAAEVSLAFHRHSTSKLVSAADLAAIHTLGFRGEALASIASVARVSMVTRARDESVGTRLQLEGGRLVSQEQVGAPQGTVVGVESLFFNVPARLEFLRSVVTERRHIDGLVTRYAMAYPAVRFRLTHDGRLVFRSTGSGQIMDVLIEVYGLETARQMLPVGLGREADETPSAGQVGAGIQVRGYSGAPSLSRANRSEITLFVNGRWVQDQGLTYAVVQAYHTLLMTGRYPVAVVMVDLAPEKVDVNVHPTKAQVRFRDREAVFGAVQRAVRRALVDLTPVRPADLPAESAEFGWSTAGRPELTPGPALLQPLSHRPMGLTMPGATPGQRVEREPELPTGPEGGGSLPMLRVVGQIGASYIIAEGPAEMVLIDQHAAHERILYEQFMAQRAGGVATQTLLEAIPVELPLDRAGLLEEQLDLLRELGFLVEHFGGTTFLVRGLPALLGAASPAAALEAVVDDLERGEPALEATWEAQIIARVCKTAAIKAGQVLAMAEMSALVQQLERCAAPFTCPHGRPTMIQLSAEQLARQFGRV